MKEREMTIVDDSGEYKHPFLFLSMVEVERNAHQIIEVINKLVFGIYSVLWHE